MSVGKPVLCEDVIEVLDVSMLPEVVGPVFIPVVGALNVE